MAKAASGQLYAWGAPGGRLLWKGGTVSGVGFEQFPMEEPPGTQDPIQRGRCVTLAKHKDIPICRESILRIYAQSRAIGCNKDVNT